MVSLVLWYPSTGTVAIVNEPLFVVMDAIPITLTPYPTIRSLINCGDKAEVVVKTAAFVTVAPSRVNQEFPPTIEPRGDNA
jgi:hypothetical protein